MKFIGFILIILFLPGCVMLDAIHCGDVGVATYKGLFGIIPDKCNNDTTIKDRK